MDEETATEAVEEEVWDGKTVTCPYCGAVREVDGAAWHMMGCNTCMGPMHRGTKRDYRVLQPGMGENWATNRREKKRLDYTIRKTKTRGSSMQLAMPKKKKLGWRGVLRANAHQGEGHGRGRKKVGMVTMTCHCSWKGGYMTTSPQAWYDHKQFMHTDKKKKPGPHVRKHKTKQKKWGRRRK